MKTNADIVQELAENIDLPPEVFTLVAERAIASRIPYNHSLDDVKEACGIIEDLAASDFPENCKKVSQVVEHLENNFTKRELAFFANSLVLTLDKFLSF